VTTIRADAREKAKPRYRWHIKFRCTPIPSYTHQPFLNGLISVMVTATIAFSCNRCYHVHLNMIQPNNGQNELPPRPQTKAEIVAQREQVRMLGIALGNWREAARQ
jgi:hypothetical protein